MPIDDEQWFDELSGESSSADPTINAVRQLASDYDAPVDDLALARLKKRLRKERLLKRKSTLFFRRQSPKVAAAAVVLLCFSVVMQSGLLPSSQYEASMQFVPDSDDQALPSAAEVEYFDQARDDQGQQQKLEEPVEQRQLPKPAALPPAIDAEFSQPREMERAALESEQRKQRLARQQAAKRERKELQSFAEVSPEDDELSSQLAADGVDQRLAAEPWYSSESDAMPSSSEVSDLDSKAKLVIELPASTEWSRFDRYVIKRDRSNLEVQCGTTTECERLNSELSRQAGWPPSIRVAQPGITIELRSAQ